jgi:hypothetical protein
MTTLKYEDRPTCQTNGCGKPSVMTKNYYNGWASWRKWCSTCHSKRTAEKHGLSNIAQVIAKNAGFSSASEYLDDLIKQKGFENRSEYSDHLAKQKGFKNHADYLDDLAKQKGFENYTAFKNSTHPTLKFRKKYCENIDKRLGFPCTTTIVWDGMLDVDHIDGNPADPADPDDQSNLQTLCKCCHAYKTNISKDYASPGRKFLRISC